MTELEALSIVENITRLTQEGFTVTIYQEEVEEPVSGEMISPYLVQVCNYFEEVSNGESLLLLEAMAEAYGSTPEKGLNKE